MTLNPVTDVLLDLGAAWRPDWDRDQLSQAVVAAKHADWGPERTLMAVARLICDEKAVPHDLAVAARKPAERPPAPEPGAWERGPALARELMGRRP